MRDVAFKTLSVSESFTAALLRLVESSRLPVAVICKHRKTLMDILTYKRLYDQVVVVWVGVVVRQNCRDLAEKCIYDYGNKYVGKTGRVLATEHMQALINSSLESYVDAPLVRHRVVAQHSRISQVTVRVLQALLTR